MRPVRGCRMYLWPRRWRTEPAAAALAASPRMAPHPSAPPSSTSAANRARAGLTGCCSRRRRQFDTKGVMVQTGTLVDATLIPSTSIRRESEAKGAEHRRRKPARGDEAVAATDEGAWLVRGVAVGAANIHDAAERATVLPRARRGLRRQRLRRDALRRGNPSVRFVDSVATASVGYGVGDKVADAYEAAKGRVQVREQAVNMTLREVKACPRAAQASDCRPFPTYRHANRLCRIGRRNRHDGCPLGHSITDFRPLPPSGPSIFTRSAAAFSPDAQLRRRCSGLGQPCENISSPTGRKPTRKTALREVRALCAAAQIAALLPHSRSARDPSTVVRRRRSMASEAATQFTSRALGTSCGPPL